MIINIYLLKKTLKIIAMKNKQSTSKPYPNEFRIINGVLMVWTGSRWVTEAVHSKQIINSIFK